MLHDLCLQILADVKRKKCMHLNEESLMEGYLYSGRNQNIFIQLLQVTLQS